MAKIEIVREAEEDAPVSVERIEVLVWGAGGKPGQEFSIGSGGNFNASTNFWLEIRYSVQGLPVFYTRNAFSYSWNDVCTGQLERLEKFQNDHEPRGFGFSDMLPETSLYLMRHIHESGADNGDEQTSASYSLEIAADMGAIFGHSAPGERMLEIQIKDIELDDGLRFMREIIQELEAACQGRHPDPGALPPGFSDWPFAREINRRAYDQLAAEYQEDYFANPLLTDACDGWLAQLPPGGSLLDAGCGHGDPVITRLLERGFRVTGSDLSPAMLARARDQFPQMEFWERASTEIEAESAFDGVCSFSSMLYLDQIDFFHSIYRLHRALKPGGLLFLYGYDLHPGWRGQPYDVAIQHWMWGGTRGLAETAAALEEHGYFKVLKALDVTPEAERQERIEHWRAQKLEAHAELVKKYPSAQPSPAPDVSRPPSYLAYKYIVVAQKPAQ